MKIIDLSQPIFTGMDVYPGDPEVKIEQVHALDKEGWVLRTLFMASHTGTHVDAFSHMDANGKPLDEIPLEKFCGNAQLVTTNDEFPKNMGLVLYSGKMDIALLDKILAANPPFVAVTADADFEVELERKLLQNGVITIGNLVNVDKLPKDKPFMLYAFPLKIKDGDGSPVRAVAVIN